MARSIDRTDFTDVEYDEFSQRLQANLRALKHLLACPGFGEGPASLGAELELSIVGRDARALGVNVAARDRCHDPRLALELDNFNLEYNLTPVAARGTPFALLQTEMERAIASIDRAARPLGGRTAAVGILPTLTTNDLGPRALTDQPRYRGLAAGVRRMRHVPSLVRIRGADELTLRCDEITLEGANTSFQVHYRVAPRDFARAYNAAQLATAIGLAVSANSPIFLGRRLWDETRIALFKQALDYRDLDATRWRQPARVGFGHGWVREGAWELFAESAALFAPLFPLCDVDDDAAIVAAGGRPRLAELRLHQGTTWRWNRAIYDPDNGGHLRIEMRALPSGPTPIDMVANAAFLVGLTRALTDRVERLLPAMPFAFAEYNFYRAAQHGLDATLLWPPSRETEQSPREVCAADAARSALPLAAEGLAALGVDTNEIDRLLGLVRDRVDSGTTAARWQRRALDRLLVSYDLREALAMVVDQYLGNADSGRPVHEWPEGG